MLDCAHRVQCKGYVAGGQWHHLRLSCILGLVVEVLGHCKCKTGRSSHNTFEGVEKNVFATYDDLGPKTGYYKNQYPEQRHEKRSKSRCCNETPSRKKHQNLETVITINGHDVAILDVIVAISTPCPQFVVFCLVSSSEVNGHQQCLSMDTISTTKEDKVQGCGTGRLISHDAHRSFHPLISFRGLVALCWDPNLKPGCSFISYSQHNAVLREGSMQSSRPD